MTMAKSIVTFQEGCWLMVILLICATTFAASSIFMRAYAPGK
jgi:hypothetical protein